MNDNAAPQAGQGFDVEDLAYRHYDGKPLVARLYRPRGPGPFPGVVDVHGGAWTRGDHMMNAPVIEQLAARGILFLSIEFRMPPEAAYPASIADVNFATRWLKSRARQYHIAGGKVGGIGWSSGGHQIILSALCPRDPRYAAIPLPEAPEADAELAYVVSCWGVLDPLTRYHNARATGMENLVESHHAYWGTQAMMDDGNTQRIIEQVRFARLPPALLIQGTNDSNVPTGIATRFAAAYRAAGGDSELVLYEGQPHAFIRDDLAARDAVDAIDRIGAFILKQGA